MTAPMSAHGRPFYGIPYSDKYFSMASHGSHGILWHGCWWDIIWDLIGFRGIVHGRQQVLDVGSWLESRGPSAGIGTTTHIYLGLHICVTPLAAWANQDHLPESMCPSCHTLERHLCYSFIINQWASALTLGQTS